MIVLRYLFWAVFRGILALRYRIRIQGQEQLEELKGPTIILPNHPAYIDPPVVLLSLWPKLKPRPLLFEGNFQNPLFYPLMKLLRAIPLPDLERPSAKARARTEQAIAEVIGSLQQGENQILWPSGYLWRDGLERLGGAQALGRILESVPNAHIVLVRTSGLWGSMTSFAPTGTRPNFKKALLKGALLLLSNLLFFMPRRPVTITLKRFSTNDLPGFDREKLNPWLEEWYNADGPEKPTFVPYHFLFGPRSYQFPEGPPEDPLLGQVTPETRREIIQILEKKLKRKLTEEERQPGMVLPQLGMDSLDRMDMTLEVEQRFGFSSEQSPATLGELFLLAQGLAKKSASKPAPRSWFREPLGEDIAEIQGETIPEAFVNRALSSPSDVVAADDLSGVIHYRQMLAGALTLAARFASLPGSHVGLLMPASVAGDIALLALQMAGKVPVVLNWTTGPANLAHAVSLLELKHVVTSNRFVDRLEETIAQKVVEAGAEYLCLEDMREAISRWELLKALLTIRFRPGHIRAQIPKVSPAQPAVILFTSGSEKAPKAVPLSHQNLISNQKACLEVLGLTRKSSILGFLPLFHSFGLSVTGLMPILSGIRVVHHPDPTAANTLVRKIADYQPTLMAGTPTFVASILDRAKLKPEQVRSLRLIFVGAEKCPDSLYETAEGLLEDAHLLEGYGITECSPVISVNPPAAPRKETVGLPLPGVELLVVSLDGFEPLVLGEELPAGSQGMLLVSGSSVFSGYIGIDDEPFTERNGNKWYVTGDLAEIDAEGYLRLAGRLKRFLKVGGEMISLPALEGPFARKYPPKEDAPCIAVEGTEDPRKIILFTTEDINLEEANDLLHSEGFRGIMRLDEIRKVDQIPQLGTGKIDYKQLRKLV